VNDNRENSERINAIDWKPLPSGEEQARIGHALGDSGNWEVEYFFLRTLGRLRHFYKSSRLEPTHEKRGAAAASGSVEKRPNKRSTVSLMASV
jgi:hypothetical protein